MTELGKLFNKYQCDKAQKHQYDTVYGPELEHLRLSAYPINILEVGVFKGASTAAWLEYFPHATIYCLDIFTRVDPKDIPVLNDPRVKWLKGDSTNLDVITSIKEAWPRIRFDVIIDDGLHTPRANASTLGNLFGLLKVNGVYFIEDVWALDQMTNKQLSHYWIERHSKDLNLLENRHLFEQFAQDNDVVMSVNQIGSTDPKLNITECDLLFVDSLHDSHHVRQELLLHGPKTNKFIVIHDTGDRPMNHAVALKALSPLGWKSIGWDLCGKGHSIFGKI